MALTKEQMESAIELLKEQVEGLKGEMGLVKILIEKLSVQPTPQPEQEMERMKKVIQINMGSKSYFCTTQQEQQIFAENNPGVKTESFKIELQEATADKYLSDPENKKHFERKIEKKVEEEINV